MSLSHQFHQFISYNYVAIQGK